MLIIPLSLALIFASVSTLQFESDDRLMLAIGAVAAITFIASVLELFWLPLASSV
jgi:hypothetical protein